MPNLHLSVPHLLSKEVAVKKIKKALDAIRTEHQEEIDDLEEEWIGYRCIFRLTAKGYDLMGSIDVTDSEILVKSKLPWPLSLYKSRIEKIIKDKIVDSLN
jgi:hypothetical protein